MKMRDLIDRLGEAVGQQPRQAPQPPKPPMPPGQEREEDEVDALLKSKGYSVSDEDPNRYAPTDQTMKFNDAELARDYVSTVNSDGNREWRSKKNPNGRKFVTDRDGNVTIATTESVTEGAVARAFYDAYARDFFDYSWDSGMEYHVSDPYQVDLDTFELYDHGGDPLDPDVEPGNPDRLYRFVLVETNQSGEPKQTWFVPLPNGEGYLDSVLDQLQAQFEKVVGAFKR